MMFPIKNLFLGKLTFAIFRWVRSLFVDKSLIKNLYYSLFQPWVESVPIVFPHNTRRGNSKKKIFFISKPIWTQYKIVQIVHTQTYMAKVSISDILGNWRRLRKICIFPVNLTINIYHTNSFFYILLLSSKRKLAIIIWFFHIHFAEEGRNLLLIHLWKIENSPKDFPRNLMFISSPTLSPGHHLRNILHCCLNQSF